MRIIWFDCTSDKVRPDAPLISGHPDHNFPTPFFSVYVENMVYIWFEKMYALHKIPLSSKLESVTHTKLFGAVQVNRIVNKKGVQHFERCLFSKIYAKQQPRTLWKQV